MGLVPKRDNCSASGLRPFEIVSGAVLTGAIGVRYGFIIAITLVANLERRTPVASLPVNPALAIEKSVEAFCRHAEVRGDDLEGIGHDRQGGAVRGSQHRVLPLNGPEPLTAAPSAQIAARLVLHSSPTLP